MISTNEMRLRMIDLEYKDLTEQEIKSEIKLNSLKQEMHFPKIVLCT